MLFNSYEFILLYLPITLILYFGIARFFSKDFAKTFLIVASLFFYSYWDINNVPILLISIFVNYVCASFLEKKRDKMVLCFGIAFNLLYLAYFKYTDFVIINMNSIIESSISLRNVVLPLGISFFTFTQTAYLVDVFRGETKGYNKSDYLLFVTIFPHLIAGPILYHKDMIPQFSKVENYKIDYKNLYNGIVWFVVGLFKKIVIADKMAVYANRAFNNIDMLTTLDAWCGSLAYTMQLYFDFCGYSEMAIGLGLLINYKLPLNFNIPYRSKSIIEFWRRWHMTLSAFLKNYLYIPLGGNRNGNHMRNIMVTMLLGGLWHGAGWNFIIWGGLHGALICINHLWRKTNIVLPDFICWLLTFNSVNIAWIFFRADNISQAYTIIKTMFDFSMACFPNSRTLGRFILQFNSNVCLFDLNVMFKVLGCILLSVVAFNRQKLERVHYVVLATALSSISVYLILKLSNISEFLYFQF